MWKAATVDLTTRQRDGLQQIVKSRTARSDHRQRAQLILEFDAGLSNNKACQQVGLKNRQAGLWRKRWLAQQEKLVALESKAKPSEWQEGLKQVLSDQPRNGRFPKFTAEQIARIITVACEDPQACGVPRSHWSLSALRDEVMRRGIVKSISTSRLQVFLKSGGAKTT